MSLFPGVQYKWFNVAASRAGRTWYQNTENAPIFVAITYSGRGGAMYCGPTQSTTFLVYSHGNAGAVAQDINDTPYLGFTCPVNFWYYLETSGIARIDRWHEMRQSF